MRTDALEVASTESFPDQGAIVVKREVIRYERKTPTSFHGLIRKAHNTEGSTLRRNQVVTSFQSRCLTDKQFRSLEEPNVSLAKAVNDLASPLMRQRMTDVHLVVVRRPDRPHLRLTNDSIQLVPGENHRETLGYHLLLGEERITKKPIVPGTSFTLEQSGVLSAIAIEYSGLESEPSLPIKLPAGKLAILSSAPSDFAWTSARERDGVLETVHLHDGVIRLEWYADGVLTRRHDLNAAGKATRRINYNNGLIATREYYKPDGHLVSREVFDKSGSVAEQIRFRPESKGGGGDILRETWNYDKGMPIRHIKHDTGREYFKKGNRWGYLNNTGKFIDTPRE
ncbi:MAG: hypothetical protein ACKVJX_24510 [Verrucomicrobiia bacterium]